MTHGPDEDLPSKRYHTRETVMTTSVNVTNPSDSATQACPYFLLEISASGKPCTHLVYHRQRLARQI